MLNMAPNSRITPQNIKKVKNEYNSILNIDRALLSFSCNCTGSTRIFNGSLAYNIVKGVLLCHHIYIYSYRDQSLLHELIENIFWIEGDGHEANDRQHTQ